MSLDDFGKALKLIDDYVKSVAGGLLAGLDRVTFRMLVNCLKSDDPEAVKEALDQLAREKRPQAIPPVYLVAAAHPHPWVREQGKKALTALIPEDRLNELTKGKDVREAVKALIEEYGHFRA